MIVEDFSMHRKEGRAFQMEERSGVGLNEMGLHRVEFSLTIVREH